MEPTIPLSEEVAEETAKQLIAAAYQPTSYRDDSPIPVVGSASPVAQPGRPPMSQGATDASALMLSAGASSLLFGGAAALVLYASGHADPTVVAIIGGAPTALVLALGRLVKRAKAAMPDQHVHNYTGPVYQSTVHTETRAVWAKTNNKK